MERRKCLTGSEGTRESYRITPRLSSLRDSHPLLAEIVEILTRLNVSFPQYVTPLAERRL